MKRALDALNAVKVAAEEAMSGLAEEALAVDGESAPIPSRASVAGARSTLAGIINLIETERLAIESRNAD